MKASFIGEPFENRTTLFFRFDGEWAVEAADKNPLNGDLGLVLKSKAKHAAIASRFKKPFVFKDSKKPLVLQYEINYQVNIVFTGKDS